MGGRAMVMIVGGAKMREWEESGTPKQRMRVWVVDLVDAHPNYSLQDFESAFSLRSMR